MRVDRYIMILRCMKYVDMVRAISEMSREEFAAIKAFNGPQDCKTQRVCLTTLIMCGIEPRAILRLIDFGRVYWVHNKTSRAIQSLSGYAALFVNNYRMYYRAVGKILEWEYEDGTE